MCVFYVFVLTELLPCVTKDMTMMMTTEHTNYITSHETILHTGRHCQLAVAMA